MLSQAMQTAMNEQIKNELHSAYIYLSMSSYYDSLNLPGFAHWMRLQAQEEVEHAMKFFEHIHDRDGKVTLMTIDAPPPTFDSPLAAFEMAYGHEQKVTGMIHKLYKLAVEEHDFPAQSMLQWFVDEQVEEEKSALEVVEQLKMIGDHKMGLFMLDRELGQRIPEEEGAEGE